MIASTSKMIFGILLRNEELLNFNAISGRLLIIRYATTRIKTYSTHLFSNAASTSRLFVYQEINGSDAISKPDTGVGTPLNEYCCESSILKRASRYAAAQGISNAGNNQPTETSSPFACAAQIGRASCRERV